ncbi:MAG: hypothetical protein K6T65_08970 [Peptococcaceae bacterium]|nr:hypothetical protein [Peptococcaceae bacterium]
MLTKNEKGASFVLLIVLVSCALIAGLSLTLLSVQSSKNSLYNWEVIQARAAADSGVELAKEKLISNPTWTNAAELVGPLDASVSNSTIQSVTLTPGTATNNKDGSVTQVVTVDVTGACGRAVKEVRSSFGLTYFPQHFKKN